MGFWCCILKLTAWDLLQSYFRFFSRMSRLFTFIPLGHFVQYLTTSPVRCVSGLGRGECCTESLVKQYLVSRS